VNDLLAEDSLLEPEFQVIAEAIPHIVWISAPDGSTQYVNRTGITFGGLPQGALRDWNWLTLVHPHEARQALIAWRQATQECRPFDLEYRIQRSDGEYRGHALRCVPKFDSDHKVAAWICTATDVDDRKQLEANLRKARRDHADKSLHTAEDQFKKLADQSITGMYIIQKGRFSYVNARFAEIFGYASPTDIIGRDGRHFVAVKDRELVAKHLRETSEGKLTGTDCCFTGLRKDGTTTEVGVHGTAASYRRQPAVVGLLQDISEKKRAEDAIRRYIMQLEDAFMRTVEVAMTLSEMRDPYTTGHERRVAEIAVAIGSALGFDAHRAKGLRVAGDLHDIGKITIPTEILAKPTRLTPAEYELMKGHPGASFDVLKSVEFPWPVAQVALQHHERLDGSGYPQGLRGDDILLEARIMAVADVVEAMSSHRPYRPGLGIERALTEIERGRGLLYDPTVVDACLKLFREQKYVIPE